MTKAYREGRAEKDPATFWYEGEIGFLDFYIIPLAKKLKDCGVFGVSSDEYLIYAMENRREWASKGREVVVRFQDHLHALRQIFMLPSTSPCIFLTFVCACHYP